MIVIRLALHAGGVPTTPLVARFEGSGDIGRAGDCTLVLPDAERRISRKHLQVLRRDARWLLRLISTNLVVELDGVALVPGVEFDLNPGAQISIGPFVLVVEGADGARAGAMPAPVERRAAPRVPFDSKLHPIDLLLGGGSDIVAEKAPGAAMADAFVAALYAGLGIATPPPARRSPAQMLLIGSLLRASIEGAVGLLAARGIAKRELGAGATMIQTRHNNPLKFSSDAQAALSLLLEPPQRGFMPALDAVGEAFDDLQAHEVAMLAGMRAALDALLERFDPAALERTLADKGVWENLLPVNRKARLWDRFTELHANAVSDLENSVDALFVGAFSAAYEAQLQRLNRSR